MQYIRAPQAWDALPQAVRETVVAVIDDGVDIRHPEFNGSAKGAEATDARNRAAMLSKNEGRSSNDQNY